MSNVSNLESTYDQWAALLKDKVTVISGLAICICTSTMAILEPCVPMWLLVHMKPRPSKWQLGAVFIPDSMGYFIGSHFAGKTHVILLQTAIYVASKLNGTTCFYNCRCSNNSLMSLFLLFLSVHSLFI